MASKVPGWLERVLLPQISELKGDIKTLGGRIEGLEVKMDGEFKTVHSEIRKLDEKFDGLDKRMDITQRLIAVEGRVRELEARR